MEDCVTWVWLGFSRRKGMEDGNMGASEVTGSSKEKGGEDGKIRKYVLTKRERSRRKRYGRLEDKNSCLCEIIR